MCGIVGIVYNDPRRAVEKPLIERMCESIHHRGPDEWGMWSNGQAGLGMKRLRIIDLAGGSQPIHNADKSVWIVFNGEIYNYLELRADLEKRGYNFYTTSDTETIVHLYEEFGEDCVLHLRGMFAFAIWDNNKKKLFIARDRLGKKPLMYLFDRDKLVFGSEIKAILQHPEVGIEVNHTSIISYMAFGYTIDPDSMFKGISKLPPGHALTWQNGRISVRQYWHLKYKPDNTKSEQQFLEETEDILKESVRIRLMSEVPLGAFLSGGVDSSLVVALMATQMTEPVKTFSIGFDEQRYNELPYARMVAKKYNTNHHEEMVRPHSGEDVIPFIIQMFDEPFADSSAIPTYYVSRLARKHVTVVLSGDGGDEMFGGYATYPDSGLVGRSDMIPLLLRRFILGNLARMLPESFPGITTIRSSSLDKDERYILKATRGLSAISDKVFDPELVRKAGCSDPSMLVHHFISDVRAQDFITRRQYLDTKTLLPCDIMTKVDRATMSVSLEARAPMLDHKFAEFAATVPSKYKVHGQTTKYLLKKLAYKLLPAEIIDRPKMGFCVPVGTWINNEWKEMSVDLVLGTKALGRGNFNKAFLSRILTEHHQGRRDHSYRIWSLMVLETWYRKYIDGKN